MLNLPIAMLAYKEGSHLLFIVPWIMALLLFPPDRLQNSGVAAGWAAAPTATQEPQPAIRAPGGGEALQGQVAIIGTNDVPGFRSAELAFGYQSDASGSWFLLQQSNTPVKEGTLANWDTTTITDGVYQIRMQIFLQDGQVLERKVTGLRVRNYTTIETSTPEALPPGQPTATSTSTPRADFQPSPVDITPLPTNPIQVTAQHLESSAVQGVLAVFGAVLLGLVYVGLRAIIRR